MLHDGLGPCRAHILPIAIGSFDTALTCPPQRFCYADEAVEGEVL